MPEFHYRMALPDGEIRTGIMAAPDEGGLADRVRAGGGVLLSARRARARRTRQPRVARRERIVFTSHLQMAISAGVPPVEAIRGFAAHVPDRAFAKLLEEVAHAVEGGKGLAEALERYPRVFSPLYVSMVATGEESGRLDTVLERLAAYLEWQDGLIRDLKQATVYPAVVITLVLALTAFLLGFVLPRFIGIFGSGGAPLPTPARVLMAIGDIFGHGWPYMLLAVAAAAGLLTLARRRPASALWLDRAVLRLPLFGPIIHLIRVSQLTYCMGLLLDAGIDITRALELGRGVVGNRYLAERVTEVRDRVVAGTGVTEAFSVTTLLPPLSLQMVAVGEESGSMPEALGRATEFLRGQVASSLRLALAILEPAIVVFLGVVVGGIALTIFYTLYQMIMAIGGGR